MKIAFLGPAYPLRGGIAQFMAILAEKLSSENHEIKIFNFIKQYPRLLFPGKEQIDNSQRIIPLNIEAVLTPYDPLTWTSAAKAILKWNPDLLILKYWIPFFAPSFGYIIRYLKKRSNIKVLYIIDNIEFHEKWLFAEKLTRYALGKSDYLITLSDTVYQSVFKVLPQFPKENVIPLHHPNYDFYQQTEIDVPALKRKFGIKDKAILFFGYIKHYKGLDILLETMPLILKQLPELQLLVAGEVYGDEKVYTEIITRHNLEKNVIMETKYISNEEVGDYFYATDVVVLPYRSATQSGITQLAFSFDKPVIATAVGGLCEIIHPDLNGYLVPAEDKEKLAEAVIKFYRENKETAFTEYIQKDKLKYSWTPMLEEINKIVGSRQ